MITIEKAIEWEKQRIGADSVTVVDRMTLRFVNSEDSGAPIVSTKTTKQLLDDYSKHVLATGSMMRTIERAQIGES